MEGQLKNKSVSLFAYALAGLTLANFLVWYGIFNSQSGGVPELYFLDVGQGDAQLVVMPKKEGGSVTMLIDAGRNRKVVEELDKVLGISGRKYIDIAVLSHAHMDHYGGFNEVLRRYEVGAFLYNGVEGEGSAFENLMYTLKEKKIPVLALAEGSRITYMQNEFSVLSPDGYLRSLNNPDEASVVMRYDSGNVRALFTGDIGFFAEEYILAKGHDLRADILKVGHHGSPRSSGVNFIHAVSPRISVIGVGENRYGHPSPRVRETLQLSGSEVYQTNLHGTVRVVLE